MSTVPASTAPSCPVATPVRDRGDACPGTLRLHSADDGSLARVRLPGGLLDAEQADVLGAAALRFGDGDLHLTSRGNLQTRGLDPAAAPELARLLDAAGLLPSPRHERVRNLVASPLSALDGHGHGHGHAALRGWLRTLDAMLCESETMTGLSGRFLFALDDGRGDMTPLGADVTLRAVPPDSAGRAALLRIGRHPTAVRVPAREAPRAAVLAAEAFLAAAQRTGAWRVGELPDGERRLTRELAALLDAPEEPYAPPPPPGPPLPGLVRGPGESEGEVAALSVVAPLGRLTNTQWRGLVDACREGAGELRLTPWRGVIVPGIPARAAEERLAALDALGLVTSPRSPWLGVTACAGRPGCAKSLADVRAEAARAVAASGPAPGPRSPLLPVHWSGCARRCGHPRGEWVDVVALPGGEGAGFAVSRVGGDGSRDAPVTATDGRAHAEALALRRRPCIP